MSQYSTRQLGQVARLLSGGTPSKGKSAFWNGTIPWLTPKDMGQWQGATDAHVSEIAIGNGTRLAPENSSFVAVRGMSLHNEIRVVRSPEPIAFNQDIKAVVAGKDYDARFLYYVLTAAKPKLLSWVSAAGHGTGVLATDRLLSLDVPDIPVTVQQAIASIVGDIDDKIELNRRMNVTLEAMAQAIFRDWFVDFGPVRRKHVGTTDAQAIMGGLTADPTRAAEIADLFPNVLGDDGLPAGWEEKTIGDLAEIVGGSTPSTEVADYWLNANHAWATPKDLSKQAGIFLFDTERSISDAGLAKIGSGLSPIGSVLLSSRAPIGYLAIASVPAAVNQGFIVLRPTPAFPTLIAYFWCKANIELIKGNANGSTFQEISKRNFRPLPALAAPADVLAAFDDVVGPMMKLVERHETENATLAQTRDYLLPRLMSGRVRVAEVERVAG